MKAKIIIVTGASGAIGAEVSRALLEQGHYVIMACRNLEKGQRVLDSIWDRKKGEINRAKLMELDMSSFDSVRRFVEELKEAKLPIDGVVNNAGTMMRHFTLTPDNIEMTVQVNYASLFLLNELLMPIFDKNAAIVNVTSMAKNAKQINKQFFRIKEKDFSQTGAYFRSKTALTIYTADLAKRTAGELRVNATDPGIVNSDILTMGRWFDFLANLIFRPFTKSPEAGAKPILNALFSQKSGQEFSGGRYRAIKSKYAQHALKAWLWEETQRVVTTAAGKN